MMFRVGLNRKGRGKRWRRIPTGFDKKKSPNRQVQKNVFFLLSLIEHLYFYPLQILNIRITISLMKVKVNRIRESHFKCTPLLWWTVLIYCLHIFGDYFAENESKRLTLKHNYKAPNKQHQEEEEERNMRWTRKLRTGHNSVVGETTTTPWLDQDQVLC